MKKNGFILIFLALLWAGAQSAFALMVGISATWSSDSDEVTGGILQVGSIIQVVAYSSDGGSAPLDLTDPQYNFQTYGQVPDPRPAEPADPTIYLAETTAANGNDIVYTGHLKSDGNSGLEFKTYVYLENLNSYDRIYIRVFSATEFEQGQYVTSYWGIGDVKEIDSGAGIIDAVSWYNMDVENFNYFEVIPEPGTLGLLWSGAFGIGMAGFWRRTRRKDPADDGRTGDGEP